MNVYYISNNVDNYMYIEMCDLNRKKSKKNRYIFIRDFNTFYDVLFNKCKFQRLFYEL